MDDFGITIDLASEDICLQHTSEAPSPTLVAASQRQHRAALMAQIASSTPVNEDSSATYQAYCVIA